MIGGWGFCTGLGSPSNSVARTPLSPTKAASPSAMTTFIILITSASRAMRVPALSKGTPIEWYSPSSQPAPRPASRRPSLKKSSVASSLASTTGLR